MQETAVSIPRLREAQDNVRLRREQMRHERALAKEAGEDLGHKLGNLMDQWVFLDLNRNPGVFMKKVEPQCPKDDEWDERALDFLHGKVVEIGVDMSSRPINAFVVIKPEGGSHLWRVNADSITGGFICDVLGYEKLLSAFLEYRTIDEARLESLGFIRI